MDEKLKDYLALCQAVGDIVITWSLIERQLDYWVMLAFIKYGGNKLRKNNDMPAQLKQKREFLKKCLNELSEFRQFKTEGLDLLHRISNLAERRHDLVHGTIVDMAPPNRIFRFKVLKTNKDKHLLKEFDFHPSSFPKLEKSLSDLCDETIKYSEKLAGTLLKHQG